MGLGRRVGRIVVGVTMMLLSVDIRVGTCWMESGEKAQAMGIRFTERKNGSMMVV